MTNLDKYKRKEEENTKQYITRNEKSAEENEKERQAMTNLNKYKRRERKRT